MIAESWEWIIPKWWTLDNKLRRLLNLSGRVKIILTIKTITRGWQQARITNLEENGARLKEEFSSVFQIENDNEKYHHDLFRHSERIKTKRLSQRWKEFERSWINTYDWWWIILTSISNEFRIAPVKLEESGKIWGKDLWVRAHSRETSLNDLK